LSTGGIGVEVVKALIGLNPAHSDLVSHFSVPLFSSKTLNSIGLQDFKKVITVEEHVLDGGFGSFVLEYLETNQYHIPVKRIGIARSFFYQVGDQAFLRELAGLDSDSIRKEIEASLGL
jgi:deoxyxylulose-5-phosphate synthase